MPLRFGRGATVFSNQANNLASGTEFYGIRHLQPAGFNSTITPSVLTTRGEEDPSATPDYSASGYNSVKGRYLNGFPTPALSNKICVVVGTVREHTTGPSNSYDPVFWECGAFNTDSLYIDFLLSLPWFTTMGNTPNSTTDRDILTNQIYSAGMYVIRDGFQPPINKTCELNYQFDYSDSWAGSTDIIDWRHNGVNDAILQGTNLGWQNWTAPWEGVIDLNSAAYMEVPTTFMASTTTATIEWVGQRTGTGSRYIQDARAGTGTWLLTNYLGFELNWNSQLQANGSVWGVPNFPQQRHWGMLTANASSNQSKFYYADNFGFYGNVVSGTCNSTLPKIGSGLRIGARYTNSSIWSGEFAMYRIWSDQLSDTQAQICAKHEHGRLGLTPAP